MVNHYREITPILIEADEATTIHEIDILISEVNSNIYYYKDHQVEFALERLKELKKSLESLKTIKEFINSNPN